MYFPAFMLLSRLEINAFKFYRVYKIYFPGHIHRGVAFMYSTALERNIAIEHLSALTYRSPVILHKTVGNM